MLLLQFNKVGMNPKLSRADLRKTQKNRILMVEDHPIFRKGVIQLINQEADLEVCGEAETAAEAMSAIERKRPDLVLVDITLKGTNGIELIKNIKVSFPDLPILVLSMHEEALYAERAMRAGAMGYVMKQEVAAQVMLAIRTVLRGELYLSTSMNHSMIRKFVGSPNDHAGVDCLTDRELEIFVLIGKGRTSKEIAGDLNLSVKTVESHRGNLKGKLLLKSGAELVYHAMDWVNNKTSGKRGPIRA